MSNITADTVRERIKAKYQQLRQVEMGRDHEVRTDWAATVEIDMSKSEEWSSATLFAPDPPMSTITLSAFCLFDVDGGDYIFNDIDEFIDEIIDEPIAEMWICVPSKNSPDVILHKETLNWVPHPQ